MYTWQNIDLTNMLEENKTSNLENIQNLIKNVFEEKWDENFIFDSINERTIKYSEFFSEIVTFQKELEKKDLKPGDIICVLLNNSIECVKMYFTALFSNITIIPIDPEKGKMEISQIIDYVKPKLIIHNILYY